MRSEYGKGQFAPDIQPTRDVTTLGILDGFSVAVHVLEWSPSMIALFFRAGMERVP